MSINKINKLDPRSFNLFKGSTKTAFEHLKNRDAELSQDYMTKEGRSMFKAYCISGKDTEEALSGQTFDTRMFLENGSYKLAVKVRFMDEKRNLAKYPFNFPNLGEQRTAVLDHEWAHLPYKIGSGTTIAFGDVFEIMEDYRGIWHVMNFTGDSAPLAGCDSACIAESEAKFAKDNRYGLEGRYLLATQPEKFALSKAGPSIPGVDEDARGTDKAAIIRPESRKDISKFQYITIHYGVSNNPFLKDLAYAKGSQYASSYHFGVERSGKVIQAADPLEFTICSNSGDGKGCAVNFVNWGYGGAPDDTYGTPKKKNPRWGGKKGSTVKRWQKFTDKQYVAGGKLIAEIIKYVKAKGGPELDYKTCYRGHEDWTAKKSDPGPEFDWDKLIEEVGKNL